jgi:hypothetical protein
VDVPADVEKVEVLLRLREQSHRRIHVQR